MQIEFSELSGKARNALPDSAFAYIDSKGGRHLPVHDANHVRAALGRIDQVTGLAGADKSKAAAKIKAAAAKFGVSKTAGETKPDPDAPDEPDDDDDDDSTQADEGAVGGMDNSDVHVPGPMNQGGAKKPSTLKKLTRKMREHFASGRMVDQNSFEKMYREAISSTGGSSKKFSDASCGCCDECTGPGCGCCDMCEAKMAGEDAEPENAGLGNPQEGEPHKHAEGDKHFTAEDGTSGRLYIPIQFGEWIQYMPAPGTWESPRFGKIKLTPERNARFVKNFKDHAYQERIPVDAEHESKLSGALGWIEDMRQNPDGSVSAYVDWNARGNQMLSENRFRYFSPEYYDVWKDPASGKTLSDVAIGGALTTKPFFKEGSLAPVIASEGGQLDVTLDTSSTEEKPKMAGENANDQTPEAKRLSEVEQENESLKTQLAEAKKLSEDLQTKATDGEAKVIALSERLGTIEKREQVRSFTEQAKDWAGETAKHVAILSSLDEEGRKAYSELQDGVAEQLKSSALYTSIGSSTAQAASSQGSVGEAVKAAEARVNEIVASGVEPEKAKAKALAEAWTPERYAQYLAENPNA